MKKPASKKRKLFKTQMWALLWKPSNEMIYDDDISYHKETMEEKKLQQINFAGYKVIRVSVRELRRGES